MRYVCQIVMSVGVSKKYININYYRKQPVRQLEWFNVVHNIDIQYTLWLE